jgi:hypothetical protein
VSVQSVRDLLDDQGILVETGDGAVAADEVQRSPGALAILVWQGGGGRYHRNLV